MSATRHPSAVRAYIGLGANLGDAPATLAQAWRALQGLAACEPVACSPLYRSAPVEAQGPDFYNAVAALDTTLAPLDLLDALQAIETEFGRERPYRNAPRTLDLDLLLHGELQLDSERLVLPHPRLHLRAFALQPLIDLAGDLRLPQGRASTLLAAVADQRIHRVD